MRLERLGRYELLEELSREAEGVVYKANDPLLDRLVAIKTIELGASSIDSNILELSFERKCRLAGALTHPNIVIVHDMGRSGDVAYIATELLDGQTLRAILDSRVPLAPGTVERIGAQVADGLDFTHQHRIVHGDVNPSTIAVLNIGIVKLSHLGNALFPVGTRTLKTDARTSAPYLSPEQVAGELVDPRSDIFSLGAVVYEMLTGSAPFGGDTADAIADSIVHSKPAPPSSLNHNIPSGFDYIVAKALSKDPAHRYQSAREMASELRKWSLEEATFFPTPLAYVSTTAQPSPIVPDEVAPPHVASETPALLDPAMPPPHVAVEARSALTRRQWLLYGIPTALLAATGGWALLSRRTRSQEASAQTLSALPDPLEPIHLAPLPDLAIPGIAEFAPLSISDDAPSTKAPIVERARVANADTPRSVDPVRRRSDEPARVAASTRRVGRLGFAVSPWGEIYVDGRRRGVSPPLREIELPPGKYLIEIRNTAFPVRRQAIDVNARTRLRIKHKFK